MDLKKILLWGGAILTSFVVNSQTTTYSGITIKENNMYLYGGNDLRFGWDGTLASTTPPWALEYTKSTDVSSSGLNFWKPGGANTGGNKLFLNDNGNIGIGTNTPKAKLDVQGDIYLPVNSSYWIGSATNANNRLRMHHNNSSAFIDYYPTLAFRYGTTTQLVLGGGSNGSPVYISGAVSGYPTIFAQDGHLFLGTGNNWINHAWASIIEYKTLVKDSDKRLKKDIRKIHSTKNILNGINSYTYFYNDSISDRFAKFDKSFKLRKQYGFMAQEVQAFFPDVVYTDENTGLLKIDYTAMIPILFEAIKEQDSVIACQFVNLQTAIMRIDSLSKELVSVKYSINDCCLRTDSKLKSGIEDETSTIAVTSITSVSTSVVAQLFGNVPNPFKESTLIKMVIPDNAIKAQLFIYDLTGKQLKSYPITGRGTTTITINAYELTPGMYHYALVVDENLVDTKMMILTE